MTAIPMEPNRRDIFTIATGATVALGAAATAWPLIAQMTRALRRLQPAGLS
jgi:Rieske Fe-S protein